MKHEYYSYVSTRTGCDAVPTVFLCPPAADAATKEAAERFAENSGWKQKAEEMAAVLIVPLAPQGWGRESKDLLFELYASEKGQFRAPSGESIPGRDGILWLWEPLLYGVGYADGAEFLGDTVVCHPNFLAAAALVGKGPSDFSAVDLPSDHWLVPNAKDYDLKNWQIPVAVDLYGNDVTLRRALCSFRKYDYRSRVRVFDDPSPFPEVIYRLLFDTTVRMPFVQYAGAVDGLGFEGGKTWPVRKPEDSAWVETVRFWKAFNSIPEDPLFSTMTQSGFAGNSVERSGRFERISMETEDGAPLYRFVLVDRLPHAVDPKEIEEGWEFLKTFRR